MRNHTFVSLGSETTYILFVLFFCSFFGKNYAQNCVSQTISLPPDDCQKALSALNFINNPGTDTYNLVLVDLSGDTLANNTMTMPNLGQDYKAHIQNNSSTFACIVDVYIRDLQGPLLRCRDTIVNCMARTDTGSINLPILIDNCANTPPVLTAFSDITNSQPCTSPFIRSTIRTFTGLDANGTPGHCVQRIDARRPALAEVVPPADVSLNCNADTDPKIIGSPQLYGRNILVGLCGLETAYADMDTIYTCSQSEFNLRRRWTIRELCTNTERVFDQMIFIQDTVTPVLICAPAFSYDTDTDKCSADIDLLPVLAQLALPNNCSDTFELHFSWAFGTDSVGPYNDVPVGTYDLTYTYSDCAGADTCTTQIVVEDNQAPVALCKSGRVLSLNADSTYMPAAYFDAGSFDNCDDVSFVARRIGQPFSAGVGFGCADVGTTVDVILRVREKNNPSRFSQCTVPVNVQDKLAPTMVCPADVTVDCLVDFNNPDAFGYPTITDNCGVQDTSAFFDEQVNACGAGYVLREYSSTDIHGNVASCRQRISVENTNPFSGDSITWPLNYQTYSPAGDVQPDSLPMGKDWPTWGYAGCSIIGVSYQDKMLDVAAPACFKILRRWTVVDWCQHDVNDPNSPGKWDYYQTVQVFDPTAPDLTVPADLTVSPGAGCSAPFVQLNDAVAFDLSPDLRIINDSPYADAGFENASGTYPPGTHVVTFRATDGCGNITVKTTTITVKDVKAPTPICQNGLTGNLSQMHDGYYLNIAAHLFDAGSWDNCTQAHDLDIKIRSLGDTLPPTDVLRFDCMKKAFQPVEMHVTDLLGNSAYCETYIIVQDNMNMCPPDSSNMLRVSGCVTTKKGDKVKGVEVQIANLSNVIPVQTDYAGQFFLDNLPYNGNYTLDPYSNDSPTNGVNSLDMLKIQRHLLGTDTIGSPYSLIAADVNNSKSVTPSDILVIRKMILGLYDEFPDNDSWRFVEGKFKFPNEANPWETDFPEKKDLQHLHNNMNNADFYAVKIGDVDASAQTNLQAKNEDRNADLSLVLSMSDMDLKAGEEYVLPVQNRSAAELSALQMTIGFDVEKVELLDYTNAALTTMEANALYRQEGRLAVLWNQVDGVGFETQTDLFFLKIKAQRDCRLSSAFFLEKTPTQCLAIASDNSPMDLELAFEYTDNQVVESVHEVLAALPNPFRTATNLRVNLSSDALVLLEVFDLTGRLVFSEKKQLSTGLNEWILTDKILPNTGVYNVRFSAGDWTGTSRVVKQ